MAYEPGSAFGGSLDQVLTLLKNMALSDAMATEIAAYVNSISTGMTLTTLLDANGNQFSADFAPGDAVSPTKYVAPKFAKVQLTPMEKLLGPWPLLQLIGMPGRLLNNKSGGPFEDNFAESEIFQIDALVWAGTSNDPKLLQLESYALAMCFKQLVRRNPTLANLVQLIRPAGPVDALGDCSGDRASTPVMCSMVHFNAYVLQP